MSSSMARAMIILGVAIAVSSIQFATAASTNTTSIPDIVGNDHWECIGNLVLHKAGGVIRRRGLRKF